MCIPGFFVKLPKEQTITVNSNIDNRSLNEVLKESFAHKGFRLLILGFFVCGFQITLIATHVPRYVQDKGLADWTGMAILALIGFFNIIGTLIMGYLSDKFSKKILLSGLYFLRGITIDNGIIIVDECQNLNFHELDTIITRVGQNTKIIFSGDIEQTDLIKTNERNGILNFQSILLNLPEFECVEFGIPDIVRSGLLKSYLVEKIRQGKHYE